MPLLNRYGGFSPRWPTMQRPRASLRPRAERGQVSFPTPQDVGAMQWEAAPPGGVDAEPTGLFGGNMNKFATLAGLAAYALSPNTAGGRMGSLAASYAMQQDQERRYDDAIRQQEARQIANEQERTRRLGGLVSRLQTPVGAYDPQEPTSGSPGHTGRGPLGVPPVGYNVEGIGAGVRPPLSFSDAAELVSLFGPQAGHLFNYFEGTGQAPMKPLLGSPGQGAIDQRTGEMIGSGIPRTPSQAAPPATPLGANRPSYRDPATGVVYPAQEGQFSPRESQLRGLPPGYLNEQTGVVAPYAPVVTGPGKAATIFSQGEEPRLGPLVPPTERQKTVPIPPGASVWQGGRIVATAPQTGRQEAAGTTAGGKPSRPAESDKLVTAWAEQYQYSDEFADIPAEPGYFGTSYGSTPAQSRRELADQDWQNELNPTVRGFKLRAYQQVFGGGGQGGTTASRTGGTLSGQKTSRRDGTYRLPSGETVTVRGGVIQ
jgi:hypothetical protein